MRTYAFVFSSSLLVLACGSWTTSSDDAGASDAGTKDAAIDSNVPEDAGGDAAADAGSSTFAARPYSSMCGTVAGVEMYVSAAPLTCQNPQAQLQKPYITMRVPAAVGVFAINPPCSAKASEATLDTADGKTLDGLNGNVTITAVNGAKVTGTYDITFAMLMHLSGTFDGSICP